MKIYSNQRAHKHTRNEHKLLFDDARFIKLIALESPIAKLPVCVPQWRKTNIIKKLEEKDLFIKKTLTTAANHWNK